MLQNLSGSSKSFGYRLMHQKLCADGFVVNRETVRILLKILHADGVELRTTYIIEKLCSFKHYLCCGICSIFVILFCCFCYILILVIIFDVYVKYMWLHN